MLPDAPQFLLFLEQGLGAQIRQSAWAYPAANVGHIVALALFAGAVAVMDVRLLNLISGSPLRTVIRPARRAALAAFVLLLATGSALFIAEASHVAANRVFQVKLLLILAALVNAFIGGRILARLWAVTPEAADPPPSLRRCAAVSLLIWLSVATCGRLIAYF